MKSRISVVLLVVMLLAGVGVSRAEDSSKDTIGGATVGGHLKLVVYDGSTGTSNGVDQQTNNSGGIGDDGFLLFFGKQLNSWLKIDSDIQLSGSASATPKIGSAIARATTVTQSENIYEAFMTAELPHAMELKVGLFKPMFSEYYALGTFWEEMMNLNPGVCTLIALHEQGLELYKNFDLGSISLPVYLDVLNGSSSSSEFVANNNNNSKFTFIHVAPEFFGTKLKILASVGMGKSAYAIPATVPTGATAAQTVIFRNDVNSAIQGNAVWYLYGASYKISKVSLYGEYSYKKVDAQVSSTLPITVYDSVNQGYFAEGFYSFNDQWRAGVNQSYANNASAATPKLTSIYNSTSLLVNFLCTPESSIIAQYTIIDGHMSDDSSKITANRFTLGWRTTF